MNNTLRTIAGSIGTALLVTVMTNASKDYIPSAGETKQQIMSNAMIHGINVAFLIAAVIAIVGIVLSFFIKGKPKSNQHEPSAETEGSLQTN
ncbi:hypothetical protein LD39_07935 [Halobacillus sp. BBL2006]|nr:hypothetical protein LD39_07935 [Halobacillus sp. BBL2006]